MRRLGGGDADPLEMPPGGGDVDPLEMPPGPIFGVENPVSAALVMFRVQSLYLRCRRQTAAARRPFHSESRQPFGLCPRRYSAEPEDVEETVGTSLRVCGSVCPCEPGCVHTSGDPTERELIWTPTFTAQSPCTGTV